MKGIMKIGIFMFSFFAFLFVLETNKVEAIDRKEAIQSLSDKSLDSFSIYVVESNSQKGKIDLKTLIQDRVNEDVPGDKDNINVLYKSFEHDGLSDVRKAVESVAKNKNRDNTKIIVLNVDVAEVGGLFYCGFLGSAKPKWSKIINSSNIVIVMPAGSKNKNLNKNCLTNQDNLIIVGDKDKVGKQGFGNRLDLIASSERGSPLVPVVADLALMFNVHPEVGAHEMIENLNYNREPITNGVKRSLKHDKGMGRGLLNFSALYNNLNYKKISINIKGKNYGGVRAFFDKQKLTQIPGYEDLDVAQMAGDLAITSNECVEFGIKGKIKLEVYGKGKIAYFKVNGKEVSGTEYEIPAVNGPITVEVGYYRFWIEKIFL